MCSSRATARRSSRGSRTRSRTARPFDSKPVILCPAPLRRYVRRLTERTLPHLGVLSYAELAAQLNVQTLGTVELRHASQVV